MAETERAKAGNEPGSTGPKRRAELDAILQRIAEHIADVDRRQGAIAGKSQPEAPSTQPTHTEALAAAAPIAPLETAPATSAKPIEPPAAPSAPNAPDAAHEAMTPGDAGSDDFVPRSEPESQPAAYPRARTATSEPPALRSALKTPTATAQPRRVALRETPAASPVVAKPTADDDTSGDPWDSQSAEALTRAYEADADAAVPPLRSTLEAMARPAPEPSSLPPLRANATPNPALVAPAALTGGSALELDRGDMQLAEMARRVEAALDRLAPRDLVEALDRRFDGLEHLVAGTTDQLARLDDIETRLGELGAKLSDEQIVALFGSLVPTAEELSQFAEEAAGKAADRVLEAYAQEMLAERSPMPAGDGVAGIEIKALREQIGAFMDDRRRNDAGTQEALETLQMAMQHVLDRIDQVEPEAAESAAAMPALTAAAVTSARRGPTAPLMADEPELHPDARHYHYDPELDRLDPRQPQDLDTLPHAASYGEARAPAAADYVLSPAASRGATAAAPAALRAPLSDPAEAAPMPDVDEAPAMPPASDRQAFIALARKAAEKAKVEADSKVAAEQQGGKGRSLRAQVMGAKPGKTIGGVRPGVLVVTSFAAILLAGYWFIAGQKVGLPGSQPTVARQEAPAEPRRSNAPTAKGSQPDVEAEDGARSGPAPTGQLRGKPDKTADDDPSESPTPPLEEARATVSPADPGSLGIALAQSATPPSLDAMMRARNQQHLANLSHRAAFTAAEQHAAGATSATSLNEPSDAQGGAAHQASAAAAAPATTTGEATRLELPPAALGPLSLRVAAAKGDASAQLEIATRYAEGRGVKQSFSEAVTWYQRAAMQGLAVAQYRLATLQERGMGLKADPARARIWYQRAAEQGNLKAMHNLAVLSASPAQGTPDYDAAAKLFTDAAERGLADSQYNLAILAESGLGMQKDLVAAYRWYTLAAKAGDQDAARRRDLLIPRLTQDMIQASEKQLAAWRPSPGNTFANDARVAAEAWKHKTAATGR